MAIKGKIIQNKKTGQQIRFIQTSNDTNGLLLEMEATYDGNSKEPPQHYHPNQEEYFTIISGEMTVRMNGQTAVLKHGDTLFVPKNKSHSMWNNSATTAVVNWKVLPALDTEYFFETATGLSNDGKTNDQGVPNFFRSVLFAQKFSGVFRLAHPPYWIQKTLFTFLTPLAYLTGNRINYDNYIDKSS